MRLNLSSIVTGSISALCVLRFGNGLPIPTLALLIGVTIGIFQGVVNPYLWAAFCWVLIKWHERLERKYASLSPEEKRGEKGFQIQHDIVAINLTLFPPRE